MIVKREYVRLGKLFETDKEAEAVFMAAVAVSYESFDNDVREKALSWLLQCSLNEREMGWCIRDMDKIIDCFERLDQERPYDSGFSVRNTCSAKTVHWGQKSVMLNCYLPPEKRSGLKEFIAKPC